MRLGLLQRILFVVLVQLGLGLSFQTFFLVLRGLRGCVLHLLHEMFLLLSVRVQFLHQGVLFRAVGLDHSLVLVQLRLVARELLRERILLGAVLLCLGLGLLTLSLVLRGLALRDLL